MKKAESRKWLACLLAVAMLIAMLPAAALAQEDSGVTVYINGSSGNDANQGTSDKPVKSIKRLWNWREPTEPLYLWGLFISARM